MADHQVSEKASRDAVHVLIASMLLLLVTVGGMFLIIVALKEVAQEFGWPRAVPSLALTLQFVGSGFGGILMGYVLDRMGMGVPAMVGLVMVGLGAILVSSIDHQWQLFLIYGVMFGLSGPSSTVTPAMMNITRWYEKRRGMAVGVVASGQGLAGIIWPPVFSRVMESMGWRDMFFWYGVFALCVMPPLWFVLRKNPPAVSQTKADENGNAAGQRVGAPTRESGRRLSPNRIQVTLCCAIFGCCVAMGLPLGHLIAHVTDLGYSISHAALTLSVTQISAFVSSAVMVGLFADRYGGCVSLFLFAGMQALTLALLAVVQELWLIYLVGALFGIGYGGIFPAYAVIVREHLPASQAGRRAGFVFLFGATAMGLGGWIGGYLFDQTGSYTAPFLIGVAFNVVNLVIVGTLIAKLRPPNYGDSMSVNDQ